MLSPVPRSKVLSIKTLVKSLEKFIEPVLLYGSSIIVYRKVDDDELKAVQNRARRVMLGLYNR
ncbi:unnamed protein product [Hymenolepis diminuta]|uniref:Uncharacterized protein n=1 Tax=Hymenolepis diminuta TaxID=6216 RepID=A0A564Y7G2_HYMDI|nr:unnamed protein product [Hymenolepis diminuta]